MILLLLAVFLISLFLLVIIGLRLRTTLRPDSRMAVVEGGIETSPNMYAPMERLLSESDFEFLAKQPGVTKPVMQAMRAERRKIFRQYLRSLAVDFLVITAQIREVMVQSQSSRADLATTLVRARVMFALMIALVEARLLLHAFGFRGLEISPSRLFESVAQLQRQLDILVPAPALSFS